MSASLVDLADASWRLDSLEYGARISENEPYVFSKPKHAQLIARKVRDALSGKGSKRIILTVPPRHIKSTSISHYSVVQHLDLYPEHRVLLGTYESTFASEWGWKVRNSIESHQDLLRVRVAPDFGARNAWFTTAGGGMFTAGIGGAFTGRGANVLIVDDPFKNWQEADSATVREQVWNWFLTTAYTRLEPDGIIIIIMTRWHEDDLVGRLKREMATGGEFWDVINLPAIAEENDLLGRAEGEALWPERFDRERFLGADGNGGIRRVLGEYLWNAIYQQRPSPPEGSIFNRGWWNWYSQMPSPSRMDEWLTSWDMTFKGNEDNDYVAGWVLGRIGGDVYVVDLVYEQMDFVQTCDAFIATKKRYPFINKHLVEGAANGAAVMSALRRRIPGIIDINPQGSKTARAQASAPTVRSGNVYLPAPEIARFNVERFIDNAAAFPKGEHDDDVDALTQALNHWGGVPFDITEEWEDERLEGRR